VAKETDKRNISEEGTRHRQIIEMREKSKRDRKKR